MRGISILLEQVLQILVIYTLIPYQAEIPFHHLHNILMVSMRRPHVKVMVITLEELHLHIEPVQVSPDWDMKQLTLKMVCSFSQNLPLTDIQGHRLAEAGVILIGTEGQG